MTKIRVLASVAPGYATSTPTFAAGTLDGPLYTLRLARPDAEPVLRALRDGEQPVIDVHPRLLQPPTDYVWGWRMDRYRDRIRQLEEENAHLTRERDELLLERDTVDRMAGVR